jgi:hypothetical protein
LFTVSSLPALCPHSPPLRTQGSPPVVDSLAGSERPRLSCVPVISCCSLPLPSPPYSVSQHATQPSRPFQCSSLVRPRPVSWPPNTLDVSHLIGAFPSRFLLPNCLVYDKN